MISGNEGKNDWEEYMNFKYLHNHSSEKIEELGMYFAKYPLKYMYNLNQHWTKYGYKDWISNIGVFCISLLTGLLSRIAAKGLVQQTGLLVDFGRICKSSDGRDTSIKYQPI